MNTQVIVRSETELDIVYYRRIQQVLRPEDAKNVIVDLLNEFQVDDGIYVGKVITESPFGDFESHFKLEYKVQNR